MVLYWGGRRLVHLELAWWKVCGCASDGDFELWGMKMR